jgi:hypothetical protein
MNRSVKSPMLGSFEDIGKDIIHEGVKAPTDIGEKIIESLTGSTGGKGQQQKQQQKPEETKINKSIARAALQQLAAPKEQEPTRYELKQKEDEQKKEARKQEQKKAEIQELPRMSSKKRRGDLYGIQGKASSEKSRNVRQD